MNNSIIVLQTLTSQASSLLQKCTSWLEPCTFKVPDVAYMLEQTFQRHIFSQLIYVAVSIIILSFFCLLLVEPNLNLKKKAYKLCNQSEIMQSRCVIRSLDIG